MERVTDGPLIVQSDKTLLLEVDHPDAAAARAKMLDQQRERVVVGVHPCTQCHAFHLTSDRKSASSSWTLRALALARR